MKQKNPKIKSGKCEKHMEQFLMLDKRQFLHFSLCVHLLCCKKCRTQVRLMGLAEKKIAEPLFIPMPFSDENLIHIMKRIYPDFDPQGVCPVSFSKWIIAGICLISGFVIFALLDTAVHVSTGMAVAVYTVFGISITMYCVLFIISNLDFFVKKVESIKPLAEHLG
jgi:hypothetical protein